MESDCICCISSIVISHSRKGKYLTIIDQMTTSPKWKRILIFLFYILYIYVFLLFLYPVSVHRLSSAVSTRTQFQRWRDEIVMRKKSRLPGDERPHRSIIWPTNLRTSFYNWTQWPVNYAIRIACKTYE